VILFLSILAITVSTIQLTLVIYDWRKRPHHHSAIAREVAKHLGGNHAHQRPSQDEHARAEVEPQGQSGTIRPAGEVVAREGDEQGRDGTGD
jgi:anti-sigma-K factor RskA